MHCSAETWSREWTRPAEHKRAMQNLKFNHTSSVTFASAEIPRSDGLLSKMWYKAWCWQAVPNGTSSFSGIAHHDDGALLHSTNLHGSILRLLGGFFGLIINYLVVWYPVSDGTDRYQVNRANVWASWFPYASESNTWLKIALAPELHTLDKLTPHNRAIEISEAHE